jgi:hypothetical protein
VPATRLLELKKIRAVVLIDMMGCESGFDQRTKKESEEDLCMD